MPDGLCQVGDNRLFSPRTVVKSPASCAGLTAHLSFLRRKLDCRVKPGNDEREVPYSAGLAAAPAAAASLAALALAALPSTIFTDQIEPS